MAQLPAREKGTLTFRISGLILLSLFRALLLYCPCCYNWYGCYTLRCVIMSVLPTIATIRADDLMPTTSSRRLSLRAASSLPSASRATMRRSKAFQWRYRGRVRKLVGAIDREGHCCQFCVWGIRGDAGDPFQEYVQQGSVVYGIYFKTSTFPLPGSSRMGLSLTQNTLPYQSECDRAPIGGIVHLERKGSTP